MRCILSEHFICACPSSDTKFRLAARMKFRYRFKKRDWAKVVSMRIWAENLRTDDGRKVARGIVAAILEESAGSLKEGWGRIGDRCH